MFDTVDDDPQKMSEAKEFVGDAGWLRLKNFMLKDLDTLLVQWPVFIDTQKIADISAHAHMLKSSCKHMGLERLASVMEQLERQLKHESSAEHSQKELREWWPLIKACVLSSQLLLRDS
jgi:HPt (histidine-containing phosphotransfer) domain-containing protein